MDHFVFALAILDKNPPRTSDELFDILRELKDRIIGGQLMRQQDTLNCAVGFSGLEYELEPAKLDHDPSAVDAAADLCLAAINSSDLSFKTLIITKLVYGKKVEHIRVNRS